MAGELELLVCGIVLVVGLENVSDDTLLELHILVPAKEVEED